jgi:hypothetical protein
MLLTHLNHRVRTALAANRPCLLTNPNVEKEGKNERKDLTSDY